MWRRVIRTGNSLPLAIGRVALGLVMLPHGTQKVFGWFGGSGFSGTMGFFEHQGIPALFALLAIAAEFLGALGLILGFLSRVAAFGVLCNMIVAVAMIHARNGFFMNWTGKQGGEGFEYHILVIAIALGLILCGGGAFSVDRALSSRP